MELHIFYALILQLFLVFHRHGALCDYQEDNWIEPNAWGREEHASKLSIDELDNNSPVCHNSGPAGKPACSPSDDAVAFLYYRKFIANLFQRQKLQYDESAELYRRFLLFTISPAQLEKLQNLKDPRDLDSVLTEIFAAVRTPNKYDAGGAFCTVNDAGPGIFSLIWDILKDLAQLMKASEVQFTLLLASAIMLGWYFHRKYHTSAVLMIVGGVLFFGYFITYLECNRKLEVEQMLETIERYENTEQEQIEPRWYTPIVKIFSSNEPAKAKRYEQIKKSSKINLAFCRPDHVFMLYVNELFLKQLEFILEKCTSTLLTLKGSLPFPFNYLAPIVLWCMVAYIIKLTFKYILSPKAWASLWHYHYAAAPPPHAQYHLPPQLPHSGVAAIHEDRISGDNLKLLLNAIVAPQSSAITNVLVSNNSTATAPPAVSGVEEVFEQLEPAPLDLSLNSSPTEAETSSETNTPPNTIMMNDTSLQSKAKTFNNNIENISQKYDEKSKVTLENSTDDNVNA